MDVNNNYKKQRQNICKAIVCCQLVRGGGGTTLCSKNFQAYHDFINHSTVINDNNYNSMSLDKG